MTTKTSKDPAVATGVIHGHVITLDAAVPGLEGRRVRILLRPADEPESPLNPDQNATLWQQWVESGEQGPIGDDEDEFP